VSHPPPLISGVCPPVGERRLPAAPPTTLVFAAADQWWVDSHAVTACRPGDSKTPTRKHSTYAELSAKDSGTKYIG